MFRSACPGVIPATWTSTSSIRTAEEIYYGHKTSASGGTLDLDSNAACHRNSDNTFKSNENVVWPPNGGLAGTYTVKLDYWSALRRGGSDRLCRYRGHRGWHAAGLHRAVHRCGRLAVARDRGF